MIHIDLKLVRNDFSLDVRTDIPANGVTAVFGPSACGKTSLLRCIAGLESKCAGVLKVSEHTWQDDRRAIKLPAHKRPLAYVFQHAALFPHMTVAANLNFAKKRAGAKRMDYEEVVGMTGIDPLLHRHTQNLSGGERQRVALARALLSGPELLLLDEPLAALDRKSKLELMPYLERLPQHLSIPLLYVSHALEEVARLADHMLLLEEGRLTAQGSTSEILSNLDVFSANDEDVLSVIHAQVSGHDATYHLTRLAFSAGEFLVPREDLTEGSRVRVSIYASDVSLTLDQPQASSILNVLPVTVVEIIESGAAQCLIRLKLGDDYLVSRITRKSLDNLRLEKSKPLFAQIKSVSLVK